MGGDAPCATEVEEEARGHPLGELGEDGGPSCLHRLYFHVSIVRCPLEPPSGICCHILIASRCDGAGCDEKHEGAFDRRKQQVMELTQPMIQSETGVDWRRGGLCR